MFTIGIDARLIKQTGVGVYIRNLLYYLPINKDIRYVIFLMTIKDFPEEIKRKDIKLIITNYKWHSFYEQTLFLISIIREKLDLMHFTYFSYPILYRKLFIATVHDVTPFYFKTGKASIQNSIIYSIKNKLFKYVVNTQIKYSRHILVPSNSVKKDLLRLNSNLKEEKISVTYEGLDYIYNNKKIKKINSNDDYLLYIGNFYPHKNIEKLLFAWKKVNTEVKLIMLGPKDIFSHRLKKIINNHNIKRIRWVHSQDINERIKYYSNALALIHPSLSEGFGLPLIEAMYFNIPIIASEISVFKELLGSSYVSFNPQNEDDISVKITSFLHAKSNLSGWSSAYQNLLKQYSFKKMSELTYEVYMKNLL